MQLPDILHHERPAHDRVDQRGATHAAIALAGLAVFLAMATWVHALRADLDWQTAPLSLYLLGPLGVWLQAGYVALAASLVALGLGHFAAMPAAARSAAPLLLFVAGALALCITAFAPSDLPAQPPRLAGFVHGVAAAAAFLCVTVAMLLQSWRLRHAPGGAFAYALAWLAFAAMWAHALWRDAPRGLSQRAVVALILLWLLLSAQRLWGWPQRRR